MKIIYSEHEEPAVAYTVSDVGRAIGISTESAWHRVYTANTMPKPKWLVGKRYYYTEAEKERIVAAEAKLIEAKAKLGRSKR